MVSFFLLSLPIFGVVGLGWAAARSGITPSGAQDALGAFSYRFALPALLIRLIAGQSVDSSFNAAFYGGYLASGGIVFALVLGVSVAGNFRAVEIAGARAASATVSNLGFLGPPLMMTFLGERGAGPLALAILSEAVVLLSLASVIMASSSGKASGIASLLLRGILLNPIIMAIALGFAVAAAGIVLPNPIDRFLGFVGGAAGPTALFALEPHWLFSGSIGRPRSRRPEYPWPSS